MEVINEILPGLFIGNMKACRNKNELQRLGITHILNCAKEVQCFYVDLPLKDVVDQRILEDLWISNRFIDEALITGGKVLVHCYAAVSRSVSVVIAYVMHNNKINLDSALTLVNEKHQNIRPNAGFLCQLQQYESQLLGGPLENPE